MVLECLWRLCGGVTLALAVLSVLAFPLATRAETGTLNECVSNCTCVKEVEGGACMGRLQKCNNTNECQCTHETGNWECFDV
jgi:hypothetical protein